MDLQPAAIVNDKTICIDYLEIVEENTNNHFEFCGNETRGNTRFTNNLQITFRSGFTNEGKGFKVLITKTQFVTNMEEGCLQESSDVSVEDYLRARSNARDNSEQNERSGSDKDNQRDKMEKKFEGGRDKSNNEGDVRFTESYQDGGKPNFDSDENTNNNWEEMRYRGEIKLMEELDGQRPDSREDGDLGDDENNQREEGMRRGYEGETRVMEERYKDYSRRRQNSQDDYERDGGFRDTDNQWDRGYRDDDYERQRNKREGRFMEDYASNPNKKVSVARQ